jgi:hypothetical protein
MKQIRLFPIIAVGVLLCQAVRATEVQTEEFIGYIDGRLGDSGVGAGSTPPGWNTARNDITVTNSLGSLDGQPLGLVQSYGAMARIANQAWATNTAIVSTYYFFAQKGQFQQTTQQNIYYSWLYKFENAADVPTTDGRLLVGVNRQNSGVASTNTFHWWLAAKNDGSGNLQVGVTKFQGTPGCQTNYATTNITQGETFLVVVRQQIMSSPTNDIIDLWINPATNTFGLGEGSVPPVAATVSDISEDSSTSGPGRFHLLPSVNAKFDEFRVGTTWADVTIPKGTCVTAHFSVQPLNTTNSSEISAYFIADPGNSTGASVQWQLSKDSGATWTDILGAVNQKYYTPNLFIGSDQGNQYRCIAYTACNGNYATSSVATVTLTVPTVTGTGTIMDDVFSDTYRDLMPVTSVNSVWWTSLAFTAYLDAAGGSLIGIPQPATSSLWLGFFENTNALPVHLAISNQIKVTFPFTPNSFNSQTANGALRFGLFDYYDSGVANRPTNDNSNLTGSGGQGVNVRGYMLSVDFGQTFTANSPLSLLARSGIDDQNLMGTTGSYDSMDSGPAGGGYATAPAFQAGTQYTLQFTVWRTGTNQCLVSAYISGGGTNWYYYNTETNFAYHRFDSFAIRPNSLETSADSFTMPEFKVEVSTQALTNAAPTPIVITNLPAFHITQGILLSPTQFKLTWESTNGVSYDVLSKTSLTGTWTTNASVVATGLTTSYTNTQAAGVQNFYRISAPLPQTLP